MGTVSSHPISTFTVPVNNTSPIDANTVRGNDNTIKTSYNAHDADTTIHLQNSLVSSRPAASTAGQMWLATDTGAVYVYLDTGSAWVEVNYVRDTGDTLNGQLIVLSTTTPQLTVEYDASHTSTFSVSSAGALTINATSTVTITPATTITGALTLSAALTYGSVTLSNAVTGTGNMVLSAGPTLTGTLTAATATFSGVVTHSSTTTLSAALTYGGVTLSNAVTGTGNMVLSAAPTFTGVATFTTVAAALVSVNAGGGIAFGVGATVTGAATWSGTQTFSVLVTTGGLALDSGTVPSHGIQFGTSAPGSLANGQLWYDGTDFKVRTAGATKTITIS